ncbi:hemerythrin domain-containing protein [Desulfovibrio sp. DV]|uniref:hemerythrin domain-containing protein n=1 Tax=Desulfovibrio sp. DV TaxID=1844708 RepID=UPI00094BBC31|nr:hemerythrin domain-containing protein [Desulfovibrio sp. DV]
MPNTAKTEKPQAMEKPQDAIALLRADHKHLSDLFAKYEEMRSSSQKKAHVAQICTEFKIHALVEEEIFYPAVKKALKDDEMIPEALVEHASINNLVGQLESMEPDGEMYDAKIKVMSEYVKHHVKEEQQELFPKAKETKLDMNDLGARMASRKEELFAQKPGH